MNPARNFQRQPTGQFLAGATVALLVLLLVISPTALTLYLDQTSGTKLFAKAPNFHVFIISVAIGFSAFVSYMTMRSYQRSGRAFEKWLLLGLLSFTLIYAPHGFLTNIAGDNIWLFILYGPASRLVMGACLLVAVVMYGQKAGTVGNLRTGRMLTIWTGICIALCLGVAALATSSIAGERYVRWSLEFTAIGFFVTALVVLAVRRTHSQMMVTYGVALALFLQSSLAFLFAPAWSHSWWYAHLIFGAGFGLLSYQVALIYRHTGSFEDIFSQEELLEKLRVANENYQRSNKELSNFAHMVSHDLKAPLRRMSTFIELLLEDLEPEQARKYADYVDVIQKNSTQMHNLIGGILELSTVDRSELQLKKVDLNVLVNEVRELFNNDLAEIGATCVIDELPTVAGDNTLLFQVFQNLIQNAIKYRNKERPLKIGIHAMLTNGYWRIDVTDNGMGFEMSQRDTVFQMLGRLHGEDISGTGAGLAICIKIIERHGGHMDAIAEPDKGATFQVFLPNTA